MKKNRTVIVGSGLAGLSAGYFCRQGGHEVTVFESQEHRGMDAHRVSIEPDSPIDIPLNLGNLDVPLRVMSLGGWKSLLALCKHINVSTFPVDAPVTMSWLDGQPWFRSGFVRLGGYSLPMLGALKYLNLNSATIGRHLWRFYWEPLNTDRAAQGDGRVPDETIQEFFIRRRYPALFWKGFLLPLLATITTCQQRYVLNYPARALLSIVHGIIFGPRLRRLKGGTKALVDPLSQGIKLISGSPVVALTEVSPSRDGGDTYLKVSNKRGESVDCDQVIFAAQANQLPWLAAQYPKEIDILNRFVFDHGELVVHQDTRVMPKNRRDWTPLSYQMARDFNESMFSVWTNPIEPSLARHQPVFQTWNPVLDINKNSVLSRVSMQRAVVGPNTYNDLMELQTLMFRPKQKVFFCGSWAYPGVPLLESAVKSAARVAHHLGVKLPIPFDPFK